MITTHSLSEKRNRAQGGGRNAAPVTGHTAPGATSPPLPPLLRDSPQSPRLPPTRTPRACQLRPRAPRTPSGPSNRSERRPRRDPGDGQAGASALSARLQPGRPTWIAPTSPPTRSPPPLPSEAPASPRSRTTCSRTTCGAPPRRGPVPTPSSLQGTPKAQEPGRAPRGQQTRSRRGAREPKSRTGQGRPGGAPAAPPRLASASCRELRGAGQERAARAPTGVHGAPLPPPQPPRKVQVWPRRNFSHPRPQPPGSPPPGARGEGPAPRCPGRPTRPGPPPHTYPHTT